MLNNYVNFDFSIMKKLWDVGHEKLNNIIGRYGILDISHTLELLGTVPKIYHGYDPETDRIPIEKCIRA